MANLTNSSKIIDEINSKLTNPEGWSNGQVLTMTGWIEAWWPAPEGYHVPTSDEWQAVYDMWAALEEWDEHNWDSMRIKLKMPFAGYRPRSNPYVHGDRSSGLYWSSTAFSADNAYCLDIISFSLSPQAWGNRTDALSVRCFRDSPLIPSDSWTAIYTWSNWAWIFHNPTEWVISISSDWQTWITIADKNLWATTVYNDWDTLSEANCWYFYQWWNNYWFPWTWAISKTSSEQVDASAYWKLNPYSSDTYITTSPWDTSDNRNLWWVNDFWELKPQWKDLELPETIWDVKYSDFNFVQLSWSSVELSISSAIEPTSNFTIKAPAELKEWIVYTLRVKNWNTAYTMTLGEWITNPWDTDVTLTPNAIDQFVFLAVDWVLELQPEAGGGGWSVTPQEFNELKDKVDELELAKDPNVTVVWTPTILQGNISNFDTNSYLIAPFLSSFSNNPFVLHMDIATWADVTTQQNIVDSVYWLAVAIKDWKFLIALSTNGTSWNIWQFEWAYTVLPNTDYHVEVEWTWSDFTLKYSTDWTSYTTDIATTLTTALSGKPLYFWWFGATSHPFKWTFNFNEWYFLSNGNKVWMWMDSVWLETRANVSLSNLDEEGEKKLLPSGWTEWQVLTKTATGTEWSDSKWWGNNTVYVTQEEYDALTPEENVDYVIYWDWTEDGYVTESMLETALSWKVSSSSVSVIVDAWSSLPTNPDSKTLYLITS